MQEANCKQEATQYQLQEIQTEVQSLTLQLKQQEAQHAQDCKVWNDEL
jgi:hypothetical protein